MQARRLHIAVWVIGALAVALAGGCAQPGELRITGAEMDLPKGEGSPGFFDRISSQKTVSENDAMRGMLFLLDGEDKAANFKQRVQTLTERGIVGASWHHQADRPVTRGKLAFMVYQACKVRGGVILTVFGPTRYYCLRELQYQGMMGKGAMWSKVTGMEYQGAMLRADEYLENRELADYQSANTE
mgnify:CR=1 FL=1